MLLFQATSDRPGLPSPLHVAPIFSLHGSSRASVLPYDDMGMLKNGWVTSIFLAIFMRKLHFWTLLWTTDGSNGVLWVLILTGAS